MSNKKNDDFTETNSFEMEEADPLEVHGDVQRRNN